MSSGRARSASTSRTSRGRVRASPQKRFVLEMIDLARRRHRWETLGYDPAFAPAQLVELRALVELCSVDHVANEGWALRLPTEKLELCDHHRVYVHAGGCLICHDVGP